MARRYRMAARMEAVGSTRERILRAAYEMWLERPYDDVTVEAVAKAAGAGPPLPVTTRNGCVPLHSFAALCAASPVDASSGRQQHHRLNRGGDRQGNWALHVIIISRLRWHQPTKAYMPNDGPKVAATKQSSACRKRHVAREVHRAITTDLANNTIQRDYHDRRWTSKEASARTRTTGDVPVGNDVSMVVTIRPASVDDADAVGEVHVRAW